MAILLLPGQPLVRGLSLFLSLSRSLSLSLSPWKGLDPAGATFTASLGDETPAQLPLSLKSIQALQDRGDAIEYASCGRSFACTLDGVVSQRPQPGIAL